MVNLKVLGKRSEREETRRKAKRREGEIETEDEMRSLGFDPQALRAQR